MIVTLFLKIFLIDLYQMEHPDKKYVEALLHAGIYQLPYIGAGLVALSGLTNTGNNQIDK